MLSRFLWLLLFLAALPSARAGNRTVVRTFPVGSGSFLKLDTYRGRIDVAEGKTAEIRVEVRLEVATEDQDRSERAFNTVNFSWDQVGDTVTAVIRDPAQTRMHFDWENDIRVDLAVHVRAPRGTKLNLVVATGSVEIDNVKGNVQADVGTGTLFFRQIDGSVRGTLDTGTLVLSRATGDVYLRDRVGDIQVGTVGGKADLRSGGGDIELQHALGAAVLYAVKGDIVVGLPKVVGGPVRVDDNGGSIYLRADPLAACTFHASSVWGSVQTTLPLVVTSGAVGKRRLEAVLNGGGPLVELHADGGYVKIDPPVEPRRNRRGPFGGLPSEP